MYLKVSLKCSKITSKLQDKIGEKRPLCVSSICSPTSRFSIWSNWQTCLLLTSFCYFGEKPRLSLFLHVCTTPSSSSYSVLKLGSLFLNKYWINWALWNSSIEVPEIYLIATYLLLVGIGFSKKEIYLIWLDFKIVGDDQMCLTVVFQCHFCLINLSKQA